MRRSAIISVLVTPLIFLSAASRAADDAAPRLQFFPAIGVGYNQITFRRPAGTLNANYKTVNMDLTASYDRFYTRLSGEWFGKANLRVGNDFTSVEREDQSITVGMLLGRTNIFAGYTSAETKDDFRNEFHLDEGLFVGAGYEIPLRKSRIGLTLAYADLDGRIDEDGVGLKEKGKTQGFSYGVGLSGPFRGDMAYKLFLRVRSYDFTSGGLVTDKDIVSLGFSVSF